MLNRFIIIVIFAQLLIFSNSLQGQSYSFRKAVDNIVNGLNNEILWNETINLLDDVYNDSNDDEKEVAKILYDFFGEISPYSGSNYDLSDEDFYTAISMLNKIDVDNELYIFSSNYSFKIYILELWESNVNVVLVYNDSDCLHKIKIEFSNGDSMEAGADKKTFRAFTAFGALDSKPSIKEYWARNVDFRSGCNSNNSSIFSTNNTELAPNISDSQHANDFILTTTKSNGKLRLSPNSISTSVRIIPANSKIKLIRREGNYWKTTYDGKTGFINEMYLNINQKMIDSRNK
ncbi:hypothetical protein CEQ90_19915 [Lewinellaceae bacterium SD302]|nr:hypothetical protein CEQ90_19915 [Lewinellaceae bacterium SD302]